MFDFTDEAILIEDLTLDEYHALCGFSSSAMKLLPGKPQLFKGRHIDGTMPFKRTLAMVLGTQIHRLLLDGTPTKDIPDTALSANRARAGKAWKAFEAEWGKTHVLIKPGDEKDQQKKLILKNLREHEAVRGLLAASVLREQSILWLDEATGVICRLRADAVAEFPAINILWDLKTANNMSDYAIRNQIGELGYHRSLDWYATGLARPPLSIVIDAYVLVFVGTTAPFTVKVIPIDERAMAEAGRQNEAARIDLVRRFKHNDWLPGGYHDLRPTMDLNEWEYDKEIEG